jgi:hypothetical protein
MSATNPPKTLLDAIKYFSDPEVAHDFMPIAQKYID